MRVHTIKYGKFAGKHPVFESEDDFRKTFPNAVDYRDEDKPYFNPKTYWHDWANVEPEDWVVADDGYIIQLLAKRELTNRYGQKTRTFRFCMGTWYSWERKNGGWGVKNFYASYMVRGKATRGSMSNTPIKDVKMKALIKAGLDPVEAYNRIFKSNVANKVTKNAMFTKIAQMYNEYDEEIVRELSKLVTKVNQEIERKFKKKPEDLLAESIANDFENVYKLKSVSAIKDKMAFYKFFIALNTPRMNSNRQLGDTPYEDVTPPLLGNNNESDGNEK